MSIYALRRAIPGLSGSMLCARAIPGLRGQSMVCTTNHGSRVCAGQSRDCANPRFARNIYIIKLIFLNLKCKIIMGKKTACPIIRNMALMQGLTGAAISYGFEYLTGYEVSEYRSLFAGLAGVADYYGKTMVFRNWVLTTVAICCKFRRCCYRRCRVCRSHLCNEKIRYRIKLSICPWSLLCYCIGLGTFIFQ